jgi:hypothetical protein
MRGQSLFRHHDEPIIPYQSACTRALERRIAKKKAHLAWVPQHWKHSASGSAKSKYYGNWYGNRLTVTICVTTKTLLFSQSTKQRFVQMPVLLPGIAPLSG